MQRLTSKKVMRTVPKVLLAAGVAVLLAACSSGPTETISSEYPGGIQLALAPAISKAYRPVGIIGVYTTSISIDG
ncbi:hypothetical protein [Pseudomonas sp. H3_G03]